MVDKNPKNKQPIEEFAGVFKNYGVALGIIFSAVPVLTGVFDLLPIYEATKSLLSYTTSLVSFLFISMLFALRRRIGVAVFPERRVLARTERIMRNICGVAVPILFGFTAMASLAIYLLLLNASVEDAALNYSYVQEGEKDLALVTALGDIDEATKKPKSLETFKTNLFNLEGPDATVKGYWENDSADKNKPYWNKKVQFTTETGRKTVLEQTPYHNIPHRSYLGIAYVSMFLSVVIAFVWCGLIEYVQQVLGITDKDLMKNPYKKAKVHEFEIDGVEDLSPNLAADEDKRPIPVKILFAVEYDPEPDPPVIVAGPEGPFCGRHEKRPLRYMLPGDEGIHYWRCINPDEKKTEGNHDVVLKHDKAGLKKLMQSTAQKEINDLRKT